MDRNDLKQKQVKIIEDMRALVAKAEAENRDLSAEEQGQYDNMSSDYDNVANKIKELDTREARKRKLAELETHAQEIRTTDRIVVPAKTEDTTTRNYAEEMERRLYGLDRKYRQDGTRCCIMEGPRFNKRAEELYAKYLLGEATTSDYTEMRNLQMDDDNAGGHLIAPEQFVARLIQDRDDITFVRNLATMIPIRGAASVGFPSRSADISDHDWTSELKTGTEDSTLAYEKRRMVPHPLAKRIRVSKELLRVATLNVDAHVRQRLAYKFAVTEEKAYMTGTGSNQPLGVFTASNQGISTGRDVSTSNTNTAIKADNLRRVKYSVKAQYRPNAAWVFHRDGILQVSLLKDGQGQYLWRPGLSAGDPDRLLGHPVYESEFAPNTFTTGLYVGIFGDFREYWIVEDLNFSIQVVSELYAETNQNGYFGRAKIDAMPVDENAFARVTLA